MLDILYPVLLLVFALPLGVVSETICAELSDSVVVDSNLSPVHWEELWFWPFELLKLHFH